MKVLENIDKLSKEETLKYAYAFMKTECLVIKECNFINPNPQKFEGNYIMPRDGYSVGYENTVPSWEDFKKNPVHLSSPGFICVAALDAQDTKRVNFTSINDNLLVNIYGNYENEAKKAWNDIVSIYKKLA